MNQNTTLPCNFDHNGECTVCDCWITDCAYARYLNEDYTYETKEQLEEMLNKRRWAKDCLRANIAQEEQIVYRGVKTNVKIAPAQGEVLPKKEVELRELIKYCPRVVG